MLSLQPRAYGDVMTHALQFLRGTWRATKEAAIAITAPVWLPIYFLWLAGQVRTD